MKIFIATILMIILIGCAVGGPGKRDGGDASVDIKTGDIDVSPCVNMPGASSRDCKNQSPSK